MWNIATGPAPCLLRKGWPRNHVLGSHIIVDGSMSKHVVIPASGTAQFATPQAMAGNTLPPEQFYFDLVEPEAMKNRLNAVSMDNWLRCVDEALRKSGRKPDGAPYTRARHRLPEHDPDQALRPQGDAGSAGPPRSSRSTWAPSATPASKTPCSASARAWPPAG
jgi:hypothetical protein